MTIGKEAMKTITFLLGAVPWRVVPQKRNRPLPWLRHRRRLPRLPCPPRLHT